MSIIYPLRGEVPVFGANTPTPSTAVSPFLVFGPSHIQQGLTRNAMHVSTEAPIETNGPFVNNAHPVYGNG
jgi:hypothetical protein